MNSDDKVISMTTETWAWINAQLDYPKYKKRKVHAMASDDASYCGIRNIGETDEMSKFQFTVGEFLINNDAEYERCKASLRRLL